MKKESNTPIYKQWWFWLIIIIVVFAGIGGAGASQNNNSPKEETVDTTNQTKEEVATDPNLFDEYEMEEFCQEDHIADIQGYLDSIGRNVSIIYTTNYNKYFNAEYSKTPDEAKKPVALLSWNGKDKDTGQVVSFMCWATKTNGEKELLLLDIDNQTVRGSLTNIYGEE